MIARRWFKEELQEAQLENEYILSSNCVRTHEEPKPFVETFGESSRRFLKVNPPAIIKKILVILQFLINSERSQILQIKMKRNINY